MDASGELINRSRGLSGFRLIEKEHGINKNSNGIFFQQGKDKRNSQVGMMRLQKRI